ncbi:alpha and gamma adaptin binding protein p34-domain-containing protein [Biscogniauxia marginata]|nr:alpha and gamma adaptin binding protein p34-domain-containing protein [Biscogniauxia marginata]
MEVKNTRRILAVSLADSAQHLTRVIKDLTGTAPEQTSTSLAGSSHNLSLKTPYYTAEVPIWLDLISSPSEWADSFLSPEAKEVLEVLGGVVLVFSLPVNIQSEEGKAAQEIIQHVGKVVKEGLGGWEWDGVGLCLGVGEIDDVDEWDDCCAQLGLEFVQVRSQSVPSRNEFGEKTGIPRVLEALQSNDWSHASMDDLGSDFDDFEASLDSSKDTHNPKSTGEDTVDPDFDPENLDFGFDREDFIGLKRAIWNAGREDDEDLTNGEPSTSAGGIDNPSGDEEALDDDEIQKIERMMVKLQAVRDTNVGLPEEQRKRAAAKAVAEVMKEL